MIGKEKGGFITMSPSATRKKRMNGELFMDIATCFLDFVRVGNGIYLLVGLGIDCQGVTSR